MAAAVAGLRHAPEEPLPPLPLLQQRRRKCVLYRRSVCLYVCLFVFVYVCLYLFSYRDCVEGSVVHSQMCAVQLGHTMLPCAVHSDSIDAGAPQRHVLFQIFDSFYFDAFIGCL